jgi:hypothetical protein
MNPFVMSIEPMEGAVYQYGFHLGTDEKIARQLIVEKFHALNNSGQLTRTIALMRNRKIVDVYDHFGWASEREF